MPASHGRELLDHARRPATGLANFSKVPFRFVSAQGQELGVASKAVVGLLRNCG
jgi:hypothetical protein